MSNFCIVFFYFILIDFCCCCCCCLPPTMRTVHAWMCVFVLDAEFGNQHQITNCVIIDFCMATAANMGRVAFVLQLNWFLMRWRGRVRSKQKLIYAHGACRYTQHSLSECSRHKHDPSRWVGIALCCGIYRFLVRPRRRSPQNSSKAYENKRRERPPSQAERETCRKRTC